MLGWVITEKVLFLTEHFFHCKREKLKREKLSNKINSLGLFFKNGKIILLEKYLIKSATYFGLRGKRELLTLFRNTFIL